MVERQLVGFMHKCIKQSKNKRGLNINLTSLAFDLEASSVINRSSLVKSYNNTKGIKADKMEKQNTKSHGLILNRIYRQHQESFRWLCDSVHFSLFIPTLSVKLRKINSKLNDTIHHTLTKCIIVHIHHTYITHTSHHTSHINIVHNSAHDFISFNMRKTVFSRQIKNLGQD